MGGKKSKRKPPPKKSAGKLAVVFQCPFCNHDKACEVKMDDKAQVGTIKCKVCSESFSTMINHLSEPIDVYSEWIDECEKVEQRIAAEAAAAAPVSSGRAASSSARPQHVASRSRDEELSDDDLPEAGLS